MVNYPDLGDLSENATIGDLMAFPNSVYPYYWAWIIGAIWIIITLSIYFTEKERVGKTNILSALAVSSFACILLSTLGTLFGIISLEIMIYVLILGLLLIVVWFFSD